MPVRPLTYGEAYSVAELQATTLLHLLEIDKAPADVGRIATLPELEVRVEPRWRMPTMAGFSEWRDERWLVVVNKSNNSGRRRFTLAHEFKHVLDHTVAKVIYARLGTGDEGRRNKQVERICDHFAACFLMPRPWVKRAWAGGMQDIEALAEMFKVSVSAMRTRLCYLGFLDDEERPVASYFRAETTEPCPAA
ncbi:hypothetical protein KBI5_18620 [Frankia sp. KB5]|nr:hypothetical protein KBI5_18620 [Frankia sp. KB5]